MRIWAKVAPICPYVPGASSSRLAGGKDRRCSTNRDVAQLLCRMSSLTASTRFAPSGGPLALLGFDGGRERGHDLERVTDHTKVGHLHDRSLGVLVDGDDDLRSLHT